MEKRLCKAKASLSRSSPIILTGLGVAGVIGTAVMAVRATPKALKLVEEKKRKTGKDKLLAQELVLTTWKCYIPSALIGMTTITCIVGINVMSRKNQASLASAYAMLNESYKQYRNAAKSVYGEDADEKIHAEMAKDAYIATEDWGYQTYSMDMDSESERILCYDLFSQRYFTTTMAAVLNAQYHVNRNLQLRGYSSLNEYYAFLGIDGIDCGDEMGWDLTEIYESGETWLDFDNRKTSLEDGMECVVLSMFTPNRFCDELLFELRS